MSEPYERQFPVWSMRDELADRMKHHGPDWLLSYLVHQLDHVLTEAPAPAWQRLRDQWAGGPTKLPPGPCGPGCPVKGS